MRAGKELRYGFLKSRTMILSAHACSSEWILILYRKLLQLGFTIRYPSKYSQPDSLSPTQPSRASQPIARFSLYHVSHLFSCSQPMPVSKIWHACRTTMPRSRNPARGMIIWSGAMTYACNTSSPATILLSLWPI